MEETKITDILEPGTMTLQQKRERKVRANFWTTLKRAFNRIPQSNELVAAYFCALDPQTPARVRGILLAALAYFVMPVDMIPDILTVAGFTDDLAVLTAAITAVRSNITDAHRAAAARALADREDGMPAS